jgi:hypothetical protein
MTVLAVALATAAALVTARWWSRRTDALGRPRRFPSVSVVALVALAVAAMVPTYLRHSEEGKLSAVAGRLVGVPVRVHCQTFGQTFFQVGGELGYVKWGRDGHPEHQAFIMRGPCGELRDYLHSRKHRPSGDEIVAVHVLTHESMHMRGIENEADAECAAMQRDAETAELLGADRADAQALARVYWLNDYPQMPGDYRSAECRPGGALDEHLPMAPWNPPSVS